MNTFKFLGSALVAWTAVATSVLPATVSADEKSPEENKPADLVTPAMTLDEPGAGRRVRQVAPEYQGTDVYHALYLPTDWVPDRKYPVLIEYTGNKFPACGSTGEVKDANLGFGLSGGTDFIWVSLPYIKEGGKALRLRQSRQSATLV